MNLWDRAFIKSQMMWGTEPTLSARLARDLFVARDVHSVLLPGAGYGRNAKPFLDAGMDVTGIEVSATAIALARSELGLDFPIHEGSVTAMPFDAHVYEAVFAYGLLYLLDADARTKLLADCARQLKPGGPMVFVLVSKQAEMYGRGTQIGDDCYENEAGIRVYFYDEDSVRRDFGPYGLESCTIVDEPSPHGRSTPFLYVVCTPGRDG